MSASIVPPTDMRARAVALALGDFRVFKLLVNGKKPLSEGWPAKASSDPAVVAKMWTDPVTGESLDNNIGVVTGGDFFVVDVDVKDGKPGLETLETLVDLGLDTRTQLTRSPTGSLHYYFKKPADRKVVTYAEKHLGPGIDTRGEGGFVVGAGSEINGEAYECVDACEMLEAPEWILARCKPAERSEAADVAVLGESDTEGNIARAIEYLAKRAPEAIEGAGGNTQTLAVANKVMDYGVSEPETFQLLLLHWNDDRAHPPWAPEELERIVGNAARYRQEPEGNRSAAADFSPVSYEALMASAKPAPVSRLFLRSFDESCERALRSAAAPLVKNFLDAGALSVMYGASNAGKTFIALDIAYHVSAGIPWNGRKTAHSAAVYVAAEAGEDINARCQALRLHHRPAVAPLLSIAPCAIDLYSANADLKPLVALINELGAAGGHAIGLVVIDTLARAMAGGDENSTKDMGSFVRHLDHIRAETGAHVMVVHHSGKDKAKGARGSSALQAATDTELEIADMKIITHKQRSREHAKPIAFARRVVTIGQDADGDAVTSCVVELKTASEFEQMPLAPAAERMWEAFQIAAKQKVEGGGAWQTTAISTEEWECAYRDLLTDDGQDQPKAAIQTAIRGLGPRNLRTLRQTVSDSGYVSKTPAAQWVSASRQ